MPPAVPPLRWAVLAAPKHGHADDEYEDAWAADPARGRFAVADGASETSFAGRWAQLLTEAFLAAAAPRNLPAWLGAARRRWCDEVMTLDLPWYAEMKREEGAFATLLGVAVRRPRRGRPGRWRALAVGDSCLIHARRDGVIRSFPMRQSVDFGNQPRLVGSRDGPAAAESASGALLPGDRLLLMTDALAQWFLRSHENDGRPCDALRAVLAAAEPDAAFTAWVDGKRGPDDLRNDDVTLLSIDAGPAPEEEPR